MPGGSFGIHGNPGAGSKAGRSSLTSKGHVFAIELADEALHLYQTAASGPQKSIPADFWIYFQDTEDFVRKTLRAAAMFYSHQTELPGYLLASIGYLDVRYYRMFREQFPGDNPRVNGRFRGQRFPDPQFRADVITQAGAFVSAPESVTRELLDQLAFGFDLPAIPWP
jgi:hypothetical protein